jgi:hypothetical protein
MLGLSREEIQKAIDAIGGDNISDNGAYQIWFSAANRDEALQMLTKAMGREPDFSSSPS